jgi:hypothetical protein
MSKLMMDDSSWEMVSKAVEGISQHWAVKRTAVL